MPASSPATTTTISSARTRRRQTTTSTNRRAVRIDRRSSPHCVPRTWRSRRAEIERYSEAGQGIFAFSGSSAASSRWSTSSPSILRSGTTPRPSRRRHETPPGPELYPGPAGAVVLTRPAADGDGPALGFVVDQAGLRRARGRRRPGVVITGPRQGETVAGIVEAAADVTEPGTPRSSFAARSTAATT